MSERDEFEAWCRRKWPEAPFHKLPSGEYMAHVLEWRWEAWQAARVPHGVPALTADALDHVEGCGCAFPDVAGCAKRPILAAPQPSQEPEKVPECSICAVDPMLCSRHKMSSEEFARRMEFRQKYQG